MRTWFSHGVVSAVLGIAICIPAAPALAELETLPSSQAPAGEAAADVPLASEPDPLFDEDFDAELEFESDMERSDPFENTNRKFFAFNEGVNKIIFDPITRGYRFVVPKPARKGIRRVFLNLNSPRIFVNDLLQLRFRDAAETLGRFALNSTLGVGGLFDPAIEAGWERHDSDFGQTLAKMGVASGPYLVIPIFGPSTVRDGVGSVVDLAFQPLAYILGPSELLLQLYIGSGNGLTALDAAHDKVEALEGSSVDFYAAMRSAYLQNRRAVVGEVRPLDDPALEEEFPPLDEPAAAAEAEVRADRR
jgi:phospholipid-binding lipoprotein MlaA